MDETNIRCRLAEALHNVTASLAVLYRTYVNRSEVVGFHTNASTASKVSRHNLSGDTSGENVSCDICCYYASPLAYVHTSHVFCTHMSTLFILMGLVSNILSMVTFRSKVLRASTTVVYLFFLALSDNIYLFMVFLTRILECLRCLYFPYVAIDVYNRSSFACKGLQYVLDISSDFSTFVILLVATERYLACYHPVFHKRNCKIRSAKITMVVLLFTICVLSAPHHMLYVVHYTDVNTCDVSHDHKVRFVTLYMTEVTLFRIIPVYLIATLNILIFSKLWKRTKRMRFKRVQMHQSNSLVGNGTHSTNVVSNRIEKNQLTSVTLLSMSTLYFVCYQPIILCYILSRFSSTLNIQHETIVVFRNYARLLCILGYSMNFFLYTLSGTIFRKEFKKCILERIHR